ncbi:MAG: hypothetical protein AB7G17_05610 [Phycisphaerales bacterium]
MRYRLGLILATGSLCSATALAQSFNIDFNATTGVGAGVPNALFPGAAQQPGTWNSVTLGGSQTVSLLTLNSGSSSVTLTKPSVGAMANISTPGTGDYGKLFDDGIRLHSVAGNSMTFTLNNLAGGDYVIYTYGWDTGTIDASQVTIANSSGISTQSVNGKILGNEMIPGVAFAAHGFTLFPGSSVTITVSRFNPGDPSTIAGVSGMQIRKLTTDERIRLYVNKTPSIGQDGASWSGAYDDLQTALNVAQRAGGRAFEIWTKQGFYRPTTGSDRNATFTIPSRLHLYGGFSGSELTLAQRATPEFFITAMSGSIGGSASTDNSYTVVDASNTGSTTLIDGFTIASGFNNAGGASGGLGGGVKINNGFLTFRNTKFISNSATNEGGAIYSNGGAPKLINCLVYNNDVTNGVGGGIAHKGTARLGLYNVQLIGNYAAGEGGGLHLSNSPADVHNCFFSGNRGSSNAGAINCTGEGADADVRFSTFSANTSGLGVGGIGMNSGADLSLMSSILWGNEGGFGGPLEFQQLSLNQGSGSTYVMSHTTVQGLDTFNGFKCNDFDPSFVDANGADNTFGTTDDNCRLQNGSLAIDAGSVNELPADIADVNQNGNTSENYPHDLDKQLRRVESITSTNIGTGPAPHVDRGAYEFVPSCPGDTNGDAVVNFIDLNAVLSTFGQTGFGLIGDVNNDQIVNFLDLNIVLSNFGVNC